MMTILNYLKFKVKIEIAAEVGSLDFPCAVSKPKLVK
jgi:hypothetical protein